MNRLKIVLAWYREEILILIGSASIIFGLVASILMYNVNTQEEWVEAQRIWTGALLNIIIYLCLYITLPTNKTNKILCTIQNFIYSYVIFLIFIKIKVIFSFLFLASDTVSGSFPTYYWLSILIALMFFILSSIKLSKNGNR